MKSDERLETLCEEFTGLEEAEKDYILGISQALAHSVIRGTSLPIERTQKTEKTQDIPVMYKEC